MPDSVPLARFTISSMGIAFTISSTDRNGVPSGLHNRPVVSKQPPLAPLVSSSVPGACR